MASELKTLTLQFKTDAQGAIKGVLQVDNAVGKLNKGLKTTEKSSFNLKKSLAALGLGALIFKIGKDVLAFDKGMVQLGNDASMTAKDTQVLTNQIADMAMATGTSRKDLLDLSSSAYDSGKSMSFVKDNMGLMNQVMLATGANANDVGEAFGSIYDKTGMAGDELKNLITSMYAFGKTTGREVNLKAMLPKISDLLRQFKIMNPKSGFKEIQNFMFKAMSLENPEVLTGAMRKMVTVDIKKLQALGLKRTSTIEDVIAAVKKRVPGQQAQLKALSDFFGRSTLEMGAFLRSNEEFNRSSEQARKNTNALKEDAVKTTTSMSGSFQKLQTTLEVMGDKVLAPAMDQLVKSFNKMDPKAIEGLTTAFSGLSTVISTAVTFLGNFFKLWGEFWEKAGEAYTYAATNGPEGLAFHDEQTKSVKRGLKNYFGKSAERDALGNIVNPNSTLGKDPGTSEDEYAPSNIVNNITVLVDSTKIPVRTQTETKINNTGKQFF